MTVIRVLLLIALNIMINASAPADAAVLHPVAHPRGVVVLTHGLNIGQQSLTELTSLFNKNEFTVITPVLSGHTDKTFHDASVSVWKEEFEAALQEAKTIANGKPIYLCGFSVGAALTVLKGAEGFSVKPSGIILLAPPLSLRTGYWIFQPLLFFKFLNIPVPSLASEAYRALPLLSMNTLYALLKVVGQIESLPIPIENDLRRIPTLVFIRDYDEFASSDSVKEWIEERDLTNWKITTVDGSESTAPLIHLLLDEKSFGNKEWIAFQKTIGRFLAIEPDKQFP